jgi:hypothetical protein
MQYSTEEVLAHYWEPVLDELQGVAGTVRYAGLRWQPEDTAVPDQAAEDAILGLLPEGGVFADADAGQGYAALRAAKKASRVIAASTDPGLKENADLNVISNLAIQEVLDLSAEPFVDVLRLPWTALDSLRGVIGEYHPALVITGAKRRHGLIEKLLAMGYSRSLIKGSATVIAVRA